MKLKNMYASSEQSLASDHENSFTEDRVGGRSIHACGRSSRQHESLRLILARPDTPGKRGVISAAGDSGISLQGKGGHHGNDGQSDHSTHRGSRRRERRRRRAEGLQSGQSSVTLSPAPSAASVEVKFFKPSFRRSQARRPAAASTSGRSSVKLSAAAPEARSSRSSPGSMTSQR